MRFSERIKGIEKRLGDPNVVLNSFILSWTKYAELPWRSHQKKEELEHRHVLFMKDDDNYMDKMFHLLQTKPVRSDKRKKSRNNYLQTLVKAFLTQSHNKTMSLEELVSGWSILREPRAIGEALSNDTGAQEWVQNFPDTIAENEDLLQTLMDMIGRNEISVSKDLQVTLLHDEGIPDYAIMDANYAVAAITEIRRSAPSMPERPLNRWLNVFAVFQKKHSSFINSAKAGEYTHAA